MSLTAQIGSSDVSFKLSQKLVSSLAEKFGFSFEDGWNVVSSRTVDNIQKRLKREKRKTNPASAIKHSRTSFSFFTQRQRPVSQAAHPKATFGELSRFVSEAWKALTPEKMAEFKALEAEDKIRYQNELATVRATMSAASSTEAATVVVVAETPSPVKEKKVKTPKTPKATEASPAVVVETVVVPEVKAAKAPKAKKEAVAPVAAPAAEVVAEVKAAKAPKAKKEAVVVVVAAPATPAATPAVKAPKAPKAVKA